MPVRALLISFCALLLLAAIGCDNGNDRRGRDYDRRGGVIIGPADHYHGHVDRDRSSDQGNDPTTAPVSVTLTGYNVRPTAGPVLDTFALKMRDVHYTAKPFHVISHGDVTFVSRISQAQATAALAQRTGTLSDAHFVFTPEAARLDASLVRDGHASALVVTGTLRVDGQRVLLDPTALTVNGVPLGDTERKAILAQLNPIADLTGLKCAPEIRQVTLQQGAIALSGAAAVQNLP